MLQVTLFTAARNLSAAAALGALYYFVLAHQVDVSQPFKWPVRLSIRRLMSMAHTSVRNSSVSGPRITKLCKSHLSSAGSMRGSSSSTIVIFAQADFDVRWCRGPIGERIIHPWAEQLRRQGVQFGTSRFVTQVLPNAQGEPGR